MTLQMFFGDECPHCERMMPLVNQLIEEGMPVEKLETWHHEENAKKHKNVDKGYCGGVPFFFNTENKQWICGATDEQTLRAWAKGEEVVS